MIETLSLRFYKNYEEATVHFAPGLNFIVGRNGMGKTNLLDAVYYLGMAKSHSTPQDRDTVMFGQEFFRLTGRAILRDTAHEIVVKVKPGEIKEVSVDGKISEKLSAYVGFLPVVILAPEDIELIQGGSIARRRYMDVVLCQAKREYMEYLQRYNKLLSQRNALLRAEGYRADKSLLLTYSDSMEEAALHIFRHRSELIKALLPDVLYYYSELSQSRETPGLQYVSQLAEGALSEMARSSLDADLSLGRTTRGVHKDELDIFLDGRAAKRFGSQGQIKSLLIALHLSQMSYLKRTLGIAPILLLDDIFDRLDEHRARQLITILIKEQSGQVLISDASPDRAHKLLDFAHADSQVFHIANGMVSEISDWSVGAENGNLQHEYEEE